jgi:ABC-2 type transport system ATP-binding protein
VRSVEIVFDSPVDPASFARVEGLSDLRVDGAVLRCRLAGRADGLVKAAARHTVVSLLVQEPDLEEIFLGYYARQEADRAAA